MTMPEAKLCVTVVGLGNTGQSIALSLRAQPVCERFEVIGHDRSPEVARAAASAGAVAKTHWNLPSSVAGADLVVLALPTSEAAATLRLIAGELKKGAVITDTAALKSPLLKVAQECLPPGVEYVGGHPLARPARPAAGAFAGARWCLTPSVGASEESIALVESVVRALGAEPLFMQPEEHDALMLGLQVLPALLAAAYLALIQRSGAATGDMWQLRHALPPSLAETAGSLDPASLQALDPQLKETLAQWLERFRQSFAELSDALRAQDAAAQQLVAKIQKEREDWLRGPTPDNPLPPSRSNWQRLLGLR